MRNLNIIFVLTVLLVLSISVMAYYNKKYSDIEIVRSSLDGNEYLVRKVPDDCLYSSKEAANIIANLREKCLRFINTLKTKYTDDGLDKATKEDIKQHEGRKENEKMTDSRSSIRETEIGREIGIGRGIGIVKRETEMEGDVEGDVEGGREEKAKNKVFVERLAKNFRPGAISESSSYQAGTSYSLNKGEKIVLCLRQKEDNRFVDMNTLTYVLLHELTHLGTVEDYSHSPIFDRNFRFVLNEAIQNNLYHYEPYHENPILYCGKLISDTPLRHQAT